MAETKITKREIEAQEAWISPTLQNSWVNYGNPYATVQYMKDSLGFVHLKGMAKSGVNATTVFTLPSGYRPATNGDLYFIANGGAGAGDIVIAGDGTVKAYSNSTGGSNVVTYVSFNNISFRAEQ